MKQIVNYSDLTINVVYLSLICLAVSYVIICSTLKESMIYNAGNILAILSLVSLLIILSVSILTIIKLYLENLYLKIKTHLL